MWKRDENEEFLCVDIFSQKLEMVNSDPTCEDVLSKYYQNDPSHNIV